MGSCIFCKIVDGDAPATKIYEDDDVLAFLDIRPIMRGHTLVIPKKHATELEDLPADMGTKVFRVGHGLALAMRRSDLDADGANLVINDGKSAFQTVPHVHLHVIPRRSGDKLRFAKGFVLRRGGDADATATAIKAGMDRLESEHL